MEIGSYPTQHEIKDLWRYSDGYLYWVKPPHTKPQLVNRKAGCFDNLNPHKPLRVQTKGKLYYLNRLIWIYFNKTLLDTDIISCIDKNPHNCKIENLVKITEEDYFKILTSQRNLSGFKMPPQLLKTRFNLLSREEFFKGIFKRMDR